MFAMIESAKIDLSKIVSIWLDPYIIISQAGGILLCKQIGLLLLGSNGGYDIFTL